MHDSCEVDTFALLNLRQLLSRAPPYMQPQLGCVRFRGTQASCIRVPRGTSQIACAHSTQVKICGVTNVEDADTAVKNGADFIGMIMWPKAKRAVDDATAAAITECAHAQGAKTVGVFVDETADIILERRAAAGLDFVQLHGDPARQTLPYLPADTKVIFVLGATPDGVIQTLLPSQPEYILVDSMKGGSGVALDWESLQVPEGEATEGWLLAGGLNAENVAAAIQAAMPFGVDVSSGVCGPDGLQKDAEKVVSFIASAKKAGR